MQAIIDGDILLYRTGYASEDTSEGIAYSRMRETLDKILEAVKADSYRIFLSDSQGNFRRQLFPNYKQNRTAPKPVHHEFLSNRIVEPPFNAEISWGEEADDALGINQQKDNTVICSIDKDLYQIPGQHYNWVKGIHRYVENSEAIYRFYHQILVGDSTDNITVKEGLSCPGIGPEKAYRALEGCKTNEEYLDVVRDLYRKAYEGIGLSIEERESKILLTGQLVYVRKKEGEIWNPEQSFFDVE